jgi:hypothetical protein
MSPKQVRESAVRVCKQFQAAGAKVTFGDKATLDDPPPRVSIVPVSGLPHYTVAFSRLTASETVTLLNIIERGGAGWMGVENPLAARLAAETQQAWCRLPKDQQADLI